MLKDHFIGMTKKFSTLVKNDDLKFIYEFLVVKLPKFGLFYNDERDLNLIKLAFSIYLYKKNKDFDFIDEKLSELFVAVIITPTDNEAYFECNNCEATGEIMCEYCDADGQIRCGGCDGKGEVTCPECDGFGEDSDGETCDMCNGNGEVTCPECDGDRTESCDNCMGRGYERCQSCNGTGEISSDSNKEWLKQIIVSFNTDLKNACELNAETVNPIMNEDEFSQKMKHSINVYSQIFSGYEKIDFDYSKVYCSFFDIGLTSLKSFYSKGSRLTFEPKYDDNDSIYYGDITVI